MSQEPQHPCVERTIALIYEAFDGGTREGGVSWAEAELIDCYGTPAEKAFARMNPMEPGWQDLVDDPNWEADTSVGGWHDLDSIGFRYYVAPGMVRALRNEDTGYLPFQFAYPTHEDKETEATYRDWWRSNWALLNEAQTQAVCEFLKCMMVSWVPEDPEWQASREDFEEGYRSHWVNLDQNPI